MTRLSGALLAPLSWLIASQLALGCDDVTMQPIVALPVEVTGGTAGAGADDGGAGGMAGAADGGASGASTTGGTSGAAGTGGVLSNGGTAGAGAGGSTGGAIGGGGATAAGGAGGGAGAGVAGVPGVAGAPGCPVELIGFGAVAGSVTGGQGGKVVTASSAADLKTYAAKTEPLVIQIDSILTLTEQLRPTPNKTFRGVGSKGGLTGGGFYILSTSNIIVQNLTISKVQKDVGDAITIQESKHVWVDHCDLHSDLTEPKEDYDDLLAVTHGSDYVTVSWTHFHDHYAASLVGHSKDNAAEDVGHLTVTYHHNWFSNTESNNPRVRFGSVHLFNNLFQNVSASAVISQMNAQVYVEANSFQNVLLPITTKYEDPQEGTATDKDNTYSGSGANQVTTASTWTPSYPYNADSALSAEFLVSMCAGVGKL